jgi:hypothetical protein
MSAHPTMFFPHYIPPFGMDNDLPYFRAEQGKVAELRLELNSGGKKDKNHAAKKIALKKIVANMTMSNNDMVALFPDVVGCMTIPSLEIKKMWVESIWLDCMDGRLIRIQVLFVFGQLCALKTRCCCQGFANITRGSFMVLKLWVSMD